LEDKRKIHTLELSVNGKLLSLETGRFAKQANGAVAVRCGDTVVLATAVAQKGQKEGLDFFPLTIDYREKSYAAGKIPGGFFKREGRPTEREILISRLTDRPIRPLFPKGFYHETQGIISVLSFGSENISDIISIIGMSAALMVSDIPFLGPIGAVRVGLIEKEFVINPDFEKSQMCEMDLVVAGTEKAVLMVEGSSEEVSEEQLIEAMKLAHKEIKAIVELQKEMAALAGKPKMSIEPLQISETLSRTVTSLSLDKIKEAVVISDKLLRQQVLDTILQDIITSLSPDFPESEVEIAHIFEDNERNLVRKMIVEENRRVDGRTSDEIRTIYSDVGILPKTHGSALFVRGETQCLAVATLGTAEDEQRIDSLEGDFTKSFMLHYNFPPFSVGEVRPLRSAGRREIGHGHLAERAIQAVLPDSTEFPYTIRLVSDILESNGSSSMASVCGGSLALMDAGVPLRAPVAGIAMGLIKEGDKVVILTDILGLEDHLGDMDFKVTGTTEGITAFQMDVKTEDMSMEILEEALKRAKKGRLYILKKMQETLSSHRTELAANAPRIYKMQIKPDKIRDVIGPGGKIIKGIIDMTGVKINVDDTGLINIASLDEEQAKKAMEIINGLVAEPEVDKIYIGKVKRIMDFGAIVEILPGTEGLLHISQIAHSRIAKVTDEINEGDEFPVKVIEIDKSGRIRLSRKAVMELPPRKSR
jgi:polyribonucleotide nucleotidyltransferase